MLSNPYEEQSRSIYPAQIINESNLVSLSNVLKRTKIITEIVRSDNFIPSKKTIEVLKLYERLYQNKPTPEHYTFRLSGKANAEILLPINNEKSRLFCADEAINMNTINAFCQHFYGDHCGGVLSERHYQLSYFYTHHGEIIQCRFMTEIPTDAINKQGYFNDEIKIPDSVVKAFEKFCNRYQIIKLDAPFVLGAIVLWVATKQVNSTNNVKNISALFELGISNYLKELAKN